MPCILHVDSVSVNDLEVWNVRDVELFSMWLAIIPKKIPQ
jgi:hypothetical protein